MEPEPASPDVLRVLSFMPIVKVHSLRDEPLMNPKSLLLFLVVAGAVVWFSMNHDKKPDNKPQLINDSQQRQIDKAKAVDKNLQDSFDQRMKSDGQ